MMSDEFGFTTGTVTGDLEAKFGKRQPFKLTPRSVVQIALIPINFIGCLYVMWLSVVLFFYMVKDTSIKALFLKNLELLGSTGTAVIPYLTALVTVVFGGFLGLVVVIYMMLASLHLYGWLIGKLQEKFLPPEQETDLSV